MYALAEIARTKVEVRGDRLALLDPNSIALANQEAPDEGIRQLGNRLRWTDVYLH